MAETGGIIWLLGAPEAEALKWDEASLDRELGVAFTGHASTWLSKGSSNPDVTSSDPSKWRTIPEDDNAAHKLTPFLSFDEVTRDEHTPDENSSDFLEHSMAILDNVESSQLVSTSHQDDSTIIGNDTTSFMSVDMTTTSDASFNTDVAFDIPNAQRRPMNLALQITDLKRIPSAQHIISLNPQTMTVNLICGLITVPQPRTIILRRGNRTMDIVELTVGDETRAGFAVNFWLPPQKRQTRNHKSNDDLRMALAKLRTGDVVLLQTVALSTFRGAVYGQSLGGGRFNQVRTTVRQLDDQTVSSRLQTPPAKPFAVKLQRVREWTEMFVGIPKTTRPTADAAGKRGVKRKVDDDLPPDTPC